jgi:hypothetical protein
MNRKQIVGSLFTLLFLSSAVVTAVTFVARNARADKRTGCSNALKHRTAEQTIREHVALLQGGNLDQAMCDFADDAQIVLPGQVVQGLDAIRGGLSGVGALLGGAVPQVRTLTATDSVVLLTFTAFGTPCTIPDGSDTYVVEKGHIVTQTVHDTFHSAPGAVCPVATPGP